MSFIMGSINSFIGYCYNSSRKGEINMRDIKFRAWDKTEKKMFIPEFIDGEDGEVWHYEANDENNP